MFEKMSNILFIKEQMLTNPNYSCNVVLDIAYYAESCQPIYDLMVEWMRLENYKDKLTMYEMLKATTGNLNLHDFKRRN